jgi:tripartite-type tricarboxylate transporter receptor subunit TctC
MLTAARYLFLASALALAGLACAQGSYPDKSVRLIVPYAPGGPTDLLARVLGRKLGDRLGQQFVIDNRPGAGTVIGSQIVASANPDGYTLLMAATPMGVNPALLGKLPYDTLRDFQAVAFVAFSPVILVAHPSVAAKTPQELIAAAKAKPNGFSVGTPGNGSMGHLTLALLNRQAGLDMLHVPYKGASQALSDLMGGHVQLMFDNVGTAKPNVLGGRTRAIAVAAASRSAALPNVPTFDEAGLKGFEASSWFALFAPAKTPPAVIAKLNSEVAAALATPELKELFARDGYEAGPASSAELTAFLRVQIDKWGKLIEQAKIKAD